MAVMAIIAWSALLLQLALSIALSRSNGMPISGAIVNYLSYFTILTNFLVAFSLTCSLCISNTAWGRFFSRATVQSALAVYIAIVGTVYALLLKQLWNPQGLQKVADISLHEIVPVLYVLYWVAVVSKTSLAWKSVFPWLAYPAAYFCYSLVRGALTGWYPYPFMDVTANGYARVFLNALLMLVAFLAVSLVTVAFSRWRGRNRPRPAPVETPL